MGFVEVKPKEWYIEQAKITKVWSKKLEENETYMHGAEDFEPVCPYINPQFRFKTKFFKVVWMVLEEQALNTFGSHAEKVRSCYVLDKYCALFVKATSDEFQIYYSENTCFEERELQFWIFAQFKDFVEAVAQKVLPCRFLYLENEKQLFAETLTLNWNFRAFGRCWFDGSRINLSPYLMIYPLPYIDMVILHELAHLRYPHHRATFWKFLSQLLGEDAKTATENCDMILGDRNKSYRYLMEGFRWVDSCFKKKQKRLTKISS